MFDTNIFDKIISSDDDFGKIISTVKHEFFVTHIQIDEVHNIPDEKKNHRAQILLSISTIAPTVLPSTAVVGHSRIESCVLVGNDDVYLDLLNPSRNNINDAIIGSTAKREQCTIVSEDKPFRDKLSLYSIPTMTYADFIQSL